MIGSTDSIEELLNFISKDKRICYIKIENNSGPANARNIGMKHATGEYLSFLDSDDLFFNNKIEVQLSQMFLKGYLFSHTSYIRKGFNSDIIMNSGELNGIIIPQIICSCGIATPTLMINRKLFGQSDFLYNKNLKIGEDVCLYLSMLKNIPVLGIEEPLTIVNVCEETCAYNLEKQQEGLINIIKFVTNDSELSKYDIEFCGLLKEYIRVSEEKNSDFIENSNNNSSFIGKIIKCFYLLKNDRPKLKKILFYRLRNHPHILNVLRIIVRFLKKILKRKC